MHAKSPIKLDLNNLFQPAIADGLTNLDDCASRFAEIHLGLKALRATGQLAFAHLPDDIHAVSETLDVANRFKGARNIIVFGIGGSALGAKSIHQALCGTFAANHPLGPRLYVIDNVDPQTHLDLVNLTRDDDNVFIFVSKSGNTAETLAQYLFAKKAFPKFSKDNVIAITDPQSGCLRELALEEHYAMLPIPAGVGGRFSVFTAAGLLPMALAGLNVEIMLEGARQGEKSSRDSELAKNPAALLALTFDHWLRNKSITQLVFMPYADRLALFTDWAAQLFAESLNKKTTLNGKSPAYALTPIKALGTTDQHSQLQLYLDGPRDKALCFIEVNRTSLAPLAKVDANDDRLSYLSEKSLGELLSAEKRATEESLRENARPNATLILEELNAFQIGQLYQMVMNVVPYLGALLEINAYDQPAVERIKKFTFGLMGKKGYGDFTQRLAENPKKQEFIF